MGNQTRIRQPPNRQSRAADERPLRHRQRPRTPKLLGVATFSAVTRQHILTAIAEYDDRGAANFLGVYGFVSTARERLVYEGRDYDARAILGVAHKHATGRVAMAEELAAGRMNAATILRKRGFEVAGAPPGSVPLPRKPVRSMGPAETPPAVCPTCFMVLPATGVCDSCG